MLQDNSKWLDSAFVRRRRWEYDLIASAVMNVIPKNKIGKLRIIEYGAGLGIGAKSLCKLGDLVITDIYKHPLLDLPDGVEFVLADIYETHFKNQEFDILISNHVLEYLELMKAFREMRRIAKDDAYYVFSVPTATWLILSVPGQILKKCENVSARITRTLKKEVDMVLGDSNQISSEKAKYRKRTWLSKFAISGHGLQPDFFQCLKSWRVKNWEKMLFSNGFIVVKKTPLLTYGSSVLPIVPTNRILAKLGLSSSFLFICR